MLLKHFTLYSVVYGMYNSTTRFADRVRHYIAARPGYPSELLAYLKATYGYNPGWAIADVGSGTGILTELFLKERNIVYGIEPNREMREAGEEILQAYPTFHSVDGAAEQTTLDDATVELVTAAQAFHWFNQEQAREEFRRILKPGGIVALIWNNRVTTDTPFQIAYEAFIEGFSTDYKQVRHTNIERADFERFFIPGTLQEARFNNPQQHDYAGLRSRVLSSSYMPSEDDTGSAAMLEALQKLFDEHQHDGVITLDYETVVYTGNV